MKKISLLLSLLITSIFCYAMNIGEIQRFTYSQDYTNYDFIEEYNGGKSVTLYGTTKILKNSPFEGSVEFYIPKEIGFDCGGVTSIVAMNKEVVYNPNSVKGLQEWGTDDNITTANVYKDCVVQIIRQRGDKTMPDQEISFIIKGQLK